MSTDATVSITPLLKRLWPLSDDVTADEIATALSHIFTNNLSPVQTGALLTALHFTGCDRRADVLSACASAMLSAAAEVNGDELKQTLQSRSLEMERGTYRGGLVDIVGTGGDSHNTYNVSTTASIIASAYVLIAKHGNRASTSFSGSADLLASPVLASLLQDRPSSSPSDSVSAPESTPPSASPAVLTSITPTTIVDLYRHTNYGFLFAPVFHIGMAYVAAIRKELGWRTIFNLIGPLANPIHLTDCIEARVIGVARRDLGPAFAEAFGLSGADKTLVVCGDEELDEISCAGITHCWLVKRTPSSELVQHPAAPFTIDYFTLSPHDFGLQPHPLSKVKPGNGPAENAEILASILNGALEPGDPILDFVLMNTAAVFAVAGVSDADDGGDDGADGTCKTIPERGPGGFRWKEGVRLARLAIQSGKAKKMWLSFAARTSNLAQKD